jgi:hypothetical protein
MKAKSSKKSRFRIELKTANDCKNLNTNSIILNLKFKTIFISLLLFVHT